MPTPRRATVPRWLARDAPGFVNLRKAGRAAIVVPLVLAFGMYVIGSDAIATYSVFAAVVGLVFADYGGPPLRRAGAYLTMTVVSAAVIWLGGLFSSLPIVGVIGTFVVAVLINLASAFGGYWALHVAPVILAYSLSVLQPTSDLLVSDRILGWTIGSLTAMIAALVLWPVARRTGLRQAVAAVLRELADLIADPPEAADSERITQLWDAVADVQKRLSSPLRPFGPAMRDVALIRLIENLEHCTDLAEEMVGEAEPPDHELLAQSATLLRHSADILTAKAAPQTAAADLAALDQARRIALADLSDAIAAPDRPVSETAQIVPSRFPGLALSHLSIWMEYEAIRAAGGTPTLPTLETAPEVDSIHADGPTRQLGRTRRMLIGELDPGGFILRNSLRAGLALSAAVAAADILPVEHGFWIVLATLAVLRSGASSTYATALQAIGGTLAGFAVAVPLTFAAADSPIALWIAFGVSAALAAYTPGAIHFAVGQAAFTVFVVCLFALLADPGEATATYRVETVAVGAVTATVLSLVLWPKGARKALGRAVAREYLAAGRSITTMLGGAPADQAAARDALDTARRGAEATFAAALNEHKEPVDTAAWVQVLQPPTVARALCSGLIAPVAEAPRGCDAVFTADRDAAAELSAQLSAVGSWLEGRESEARAVVDPRSRPAPDSCLEGAADDPTEAREVVNLLAWSSYIDRLSVRVAHAESALRDVAGKGGRSPDRARRAKAR